MSNQTLLQVDNLSKHYTHGSSTVKALDGVSFDVEQGQSTAIVGPSGSGKTTLLEIMGGLNKPTSGHVYINGVDPFAGSDNDISRFRNRTIGFVFQSMHLQEYFTAIENVMLPMLVARMNRSEAQDKAFTLLKKVGLDDRTHHRPSQLSGGQKQRVAIARSLALDPVLLMADEPTSKLDKENEDIVLDIFHNISQSGVNVLVITHDDSVAKEFKQIITLKHGRIS